MLGWTLVLTDPQLCVWNSGAIGAVWARRGGAERTLEDKDGLKHTYELYTLKAQFSQKWTFCHQLLILMLLQTCMSLFRVSDSVSHLSLHLLYYTVKSSVILPNISFTVLTLQINERKSIIQVWNKIMLSKHWHNFNFWVNYPFRQINNHT